MEKKNMYIDEDFGRSLDIIPIDQMDQYQKGELVDYSKTLSKIVCLDLNKSINKDIKEIGGASIFDNCKNVSDTFFYAPPSFSRKYIWNIDYFKLHAIMEDFPWYKERYAKVDELTKNLPSCTEKELVKSIKSHQYVKAAWLLMNIDKEVSCLNKEIKELIPIEYYMTMRLCQTIYYYKLNRYQIEFKDEYIDPSEPMYTKVNTLFIECK